MADRQQEVIVIIILVNLLFLFLVMVVIFAILKYKKRQQNHIKETQDLHNHFQKEILHAQLEIQEQTFKTISQEMHDNICQILTLAKLNLNTVDIKKEEKAMEKIMDAKESVGKAIQFLRDLSRTLNTENIISQGLSKILESEVLLLQKTGPVQTHYEVKGEPVMIDPQKELIVFRIVQEALHNIIKHANASCIRVTATYEKKFLNVCITDNGCGFDMNYSNFPGSGLHNMQSRAKLIGATFLINSTIGKGTLIQLQLPVTS